MTVRKLYGLILSLLNISEIVEGDITKPNDKPTSGEDKKYEKKQCGN